MASASIHHNVNVTWQMHSGTDLNSSDDVQKTLTPIAFLPFKSDRQWQVANTLLSTQSLLYHLFRITLIN